MRFFARAATLMSTLRFRLITLDLDETLWPCMPVIQAAEEALYAWLRMRAPRLADAHDVATMREHRKRLMQDSPEIAHDLGQIRRRSLLSLLDAYAYPAALADEALAFFMDHRNRVTPYEDVLPNLQRLARRYALVSVTNGNSNVSATPLRGLFQHSLTAVDAGAAKPDPAIFKLALALTGCRTDECLHLGDDPWLDVQAARALGLTAVWINRDGRSWPDELPAPTRTVTDLHELTAWLDGEAEDDGDGL